MTSDIVLFIGNYRLQDGGNVQLFNELPPQTDS